MDKTYFDANDYLLKYSNQKINKFKGTSKEQEYQRLKKIASDNLYQNSIRSNKSFLDIILGI